MTKFKAGDRVRVIYADTVDWYKEGDVGEVVEACAMGGFVRFADGYAGYAAEEQLELVSEDNKNWWETPEGIEWLSTQQDVEEQFLKSQEKKEESTYHVGQRFWVTPLWGDVGWYCLLAQVEADVVCLIGLQSGNRINEPIHVLDSRKITENEMKMIAEDCSFQLM